MGRWLTALLGDVAPLCFLIGEPSRMQLACECNPTARFPALPLDLASLTFCNCVTANSGCNASSGFDKYDAITVVLQQPQRS